MKKYIIRFSLFSVLFTLFLGFNFPIYAKNESGLSISPAFQEIIFEENDREKTASFELTNNTDQPLQFQFEAIPYSAVDYVGSLSFFNPSLNESVGSINYVTFDTDQLVIEPHATQKVVFHVQNRPNLSPGGHYAAIVSRLMKDEKQDEVIPAVGSLLMIRKKDGEQVNLSLIDVAHDSTGFFSVPKRVELSFENQGNVHVIPRGTVKIIDMFDRVVKQGTINENSSLVLPGMRRVIGVDVAKSRMIFPISFLTVDVSGNVDGYETKYTHQSSFFYISPLLLLLVIIMCVAIPLLWFFRRRKVHHKKHE